mgnify:CR=1 FL=1
MSTEFTPEPKLTYEQVLASERPPVKTKCRAPMSTVLLTPEQYQPGTDEERIPVLLASLSPRLRLFVKNRFIEELDAAELNKLGYSDRQIRELETESLDALREVLSEHKLREQLGRHIAMDSGWHGSARLKPTPAEQKPQRTKKADPVPQVPTALQVRLQELIGQQDSKKAVGELVQCLQPAIRQIAAKYARVNRLCDDDALVEPDRFLSGALNDSGHPVKICARIAS